MLLLLGIVAVIAGLVDFAVVAVMRRKEAAASGGPDAAPPNPALGMLQRTGAMTLVIGVVLVIVGLVT